MSPVIRTLVIALLALSAWAFHEGGDEIMCWSTVVGSGFAPAFVTSGCPSIFSLEWITPPPGGQLESETQFELSYRFTYGGNLTQIVRTATGQWSHIAHTNAHACKQDNGFCTPLVAATPHLVTHATAQYLNFSTDRVNSNGNPYVDITSVMQLSDLGLFTIIGHVRVLVKDGFNNTVQYEVAVGPKNGTRTDIVEREESLSIERGAIIALGLAAGFVACWVVVLLVLVCAYAKHRVIQASTFSFNVLTLVCALICLSTIIPLAITPNDYTCALQPWLIFPASCAIMALLAAKMYRVWRMFISKRSGMLLIKDYRLLLYAAVPVAAVVLVLIVWTAVPQARLQEDHSRVQNAESWKMCSSEAWRPFIAVLLFIEAALLLAALVFAVLTRNVTTLFNESRWIGLAIYNLLVVSCVFIPLSAVFRQPTVAFALRSLGIILAVLGTVTVLFVPKFWLILTRKRSEFQRTRLNTITSSLESDDKATEADSTANYMSDVEDVDMHWDDDSSQEDPEQGKHVGFDETAPTSGLRFNKCLRGGRLIDDVAQKVETAHSFSTNILQRQRNGFVIRPKELKELHTAIVDLEKTFGVDVAAATAAAAGTTAATAGAPHADGFAPGADAEPKKEKAPPTSSAAPFLSSLLAGGSAAVAASKDDSSASSSSSSSSSPSSSSFASKPAAQKKDSPQASSHSRSRSGSDSSSHSSSHSSSSARASSAAAPSSSSASNDNSKRSQHSQAKAQQSFSAPVQSLAHKQADDEGSSGSSGTESSWSAEIAPNSSRSVKPDKDEI